MDNSRVVITGIGVTSSIGSSFREFSASLLKGVCGARPATVIDTTGFKTDIACEIRANELPVEAHDVDRSRVGRAATFALAATRMAIRDAAIQTPAPEMRGVLALGTTDGGSHELDSIVARHADGTGLDRDKDLIHQVPASHIAEAVVGQLGLGRMESMVSGAACAASSQAIGLAFDAVASGDVEIALAGGADALCRRGYAAFTRLNLMSKEPCRPFDVDRSGLTLGEGAGVLVLESLEHARARGAKVYAEILSYGANCDRHHPVHPLTSSVTDCMALAMDRADVRPGEVDLVSTHGTGTPTNDVTESQAMADLFTASPKVTAVKSMVGHTMGAAGVMGTLACLTAIEHQVIPPIANHRRIDPRCDVVCLQTAQAAEVTIAQSNALGFFGNNAVILLKRFLGE